MRALILLVGLLVAAGGGTPAPAAPSPADLDALLGPVALYPDQLLGPMLISAGNPATVGALHEWMGSHEGLKGSDLQASAATAGFGDSYAALVLFPDVVKWMASQLDWTTKVGKAFAADRSAVFASIQRLRKKAQTAGTLKSTPQQSVETKQTSSGDNVIVIEPTNPAIQLTICGGWTSVLGAAKDHVGQAGNFTLGILFNVNPWCRSRASTPGTA